MLLKCEITIRLCPTVYINGFNPVSTLFVNGHFAKTPFRRFIFGRIIFGRTSTTLNKIIDEGKILINKFLYKMRTNYILRNLHKS